MDSVTLFYDPLFLAHDAGPSHPERPDRLRAIVQRLQNNGLWDILEHRDFAPATTEEVERIHTHRHLERIRDLSAQGGGRIDSDTVVSSDSFAAAMQAAGAAIAVARTVCGADGTRAFAAVRPPGHHAEPERSMGFCLFSNVAIAARAAQAEFGIRRVAIVDWDVHHGNGTEVAFWNDPNVLYASIHQYPWYPGTGAVDHIGGPEARGLTVNVPLPAQSEDGDFLAALDQVILPVLEHFRPEILLVSAGQDAHTADPLSGTCVTTAGYGAMAGRLVAFTERHAGGRLGMVLEGGYNLAALGASVAQIIRVLGGEPAPEVDARPTIGGSRAVTAAVATHFRHGLLH